MHKEKESECSYLRGQGEGAEAGRLAVGGVEQRSPSQPSCRSVRHKRKSSHLDPGFSVGTGLSGKDKALAAGRSQLKHERVHDLPV